MRFLLIAMLLLAGPAFGQVGGQQYGPGPCPVGASSCVVTATGSVTPRSTGDRAANVIHVKDYGATGNGTTDDTAAINLATAAFRTSLAAGNAAKLAFDHGNYVVRTSGGINLTGINSYLGDIDGNGATILCQVTTICVDATGTQHIHWYGMSIQGNPGFIPSVGLQIARVGGGATACGNQTFYGLTINGYFSTAALLNGACETDQFFGGLLENDNPAANCYAYIMDGSNHWNWTSSYVTVTTPVDTAMTMGDNLHSGVTIVSSCASKGVMWAENTAHTGFVAGYGLSRGPTAFFALYDDGHGANLSFSADQHTEGVMTDIFLQTGATVAPVIAGLDYSDHASQATASVFKLDTGITSATLRSVNVRFTQAVGSPPVMFSQPQLWTVSGTFTLPTLAYWTSPLSFSGTLCLVSTCTTIVGPVDAVGNLAAAAFSCNRLLVMSYTGPLCNLRRSSDSATQDFYPLASGDAPLAQILAWAGASVSIFVTEEYDQTGHGCHATQTTAANQPTFTSYQSGGRGRPTVTFGDGTILALATTTCSAMTGQFATGGFATSVAYVATATPGSQDYLWNNSGQTTAVNANGNTLVFGQKAATTNGSWRTTAGSLTVGLHVYDFSYSQSLNANNPVSTFDGTVQSYLSTTAPVGALTANINQTIIGNNSGTVGNTGWPGGISETIFWKDAGTLTSVQKEAIRLNQGAYYGVTVQ